MWVLIYRLIVIFLHFATAVNRLKQYREFGAEATPEMVIYDRGGSLPAAAKALQAEGVQKVGIHPRGQVEWKKDQKIVKNEPGNTAVSIGRLKSSNYGFPHRQERSVKTQDAAGQKGDSVGSI